MLRKVQLRRMRLAGVVKARAAQPPAAKGDGLAVASVESYRLREPASGRAYSLLKVATRSGLAGYGECPSVSESDLALARRVLTGKPASAYEQIGLELASRPGVRAAANVALLDVLAKFAKAPLFQFLGGPTRYKVRAMAPLEGDSDAALLECLRRARAAGYRAFMVQAPRGTARSQGQAFVSAAKKRLESLREAAGEDADFVLDGAGALSPGDAANLCAVLERFHLYWFDEPCPAANTGAARRLAAGNVMALGFGRDIREPAAIQDLLREDAVDVIRPGIGWNGITQIRKMAALAETYYVAVAPFHDGGPVATAAALHLAASLPNFFIQQVPYPRAEADRAMRAEIAGAAVEAVKDGFIALPTAPGLGISVNESALAKYKERAS